MQIKTRDLKMTPNELLKVAVFWQMRPVWVLSAIGILLGLLLRMFDVAVVAVLVPLLIVFAFAPFLR